MACHTCFRADCPLSATAWKTNIRSCALRGTNPCLTFHFVLRFCFLTCLHPFCKSDASNKFSCICQAPAITSAPSRPCLPVRTPAPVSSWAASHLSAPAIVVPMSPPRRHHHISRLAAARLGQPVPAGRNSHRLPCTLSSGRPVPLPLPSKVRVKDQASGRPASCGHGPHLRCGQARRDGLGAPGRRLGLRGPQSHALQPLRQGGRDHDSGGGCQDTAHDRASRAQLPHSC